MTNKCRRGAQLSPAENNARAIWFPIKTEIAHFKNNNNFFLKFFET